MSWISLRTRQDPERLFAKFARFRRRLDQSSEFAQGIRLQRVLRQRPAIIFDRLLLPARRAQKIRNRVVEGRVTRLAGGGFPEKRPSLLQILGIALFRCQLYVSQA